MLKSWVSKPPPARPRQFDNTYEWLGQSFLALCNEPLCLRRPAYAWGVLQGAALAKVLDYQSVAVVEFGVAGGAGLLSLERIAELVEALTAVQINVHGFDSGAGLPSAKDYRDMPHMWEAGFFPMDRDKLVARLHRANLHLGLIHTTLPDFVSANSGPIGFMSFDLDSYTSTREALQCLLAEADSFLPRVACYFDDIMGYFGNDYAGERLAIAEFNSEQPLRKLSLQHGLKWCVPEAHREAMWPAQMYFAHLFDHRLYNAPACFKRGSVIDIEDRISF